jgi:hypothetical protein
MINKDKESGKINDFTAFYRITYFPMSRLWLKFRSFEKGKREQEPATISSVLQTN